MTNYYKVLIIRPKGTLLNTYEICDLEVLKDDLSFLYPNLDVGKLIQNNEYIDCNNFKYLFHHFSW